MTLIAKNLTRSEFYPTYQIFNDIFCILNKCKLKKFARDWGATSELEFLKKSNNFSWRVRNEFDSFKLRRRKFKPIPYVTK